MGRGRVVGSVGVVLGVGVLGGCYDAPKPAIAVRNGMSIEVVLRITYLDSGWSNEHELPPGSGSGELIRDCKPGSVTVETPEGELISSMDLDLCPHWVVIVNEDGSLTYREQ